MTEFFGLYAFAGKSTAWLVPGLMSIILAFTDSLQYAMISIVLINLIGIESPGLTSSLAIAKHVAK